MPKQINARIGVIRVGRVCQRLVEGNLRVQSSHPATHHHRCQQATGLRQPLTPFEYPHALSLLPNSGWPARPLTLKYFFRWSCHVNMLVILCPVQLEITAEQMIDDFPVGISCQDTGHTDSTGTRPTGPRFP